MATTGHEERFRRLYADESRPRLERMTEALLGLESGWDPAALDQVFREAHTLKGGAAVVGFADVARVAHTMEEVLEDLRETRQALPAASVDVLLGVVDALTALIAGALAGEHVAARADEAIDAVVSLRPGAEPQPPGSPPPGAHRAPAPAAVAAPPAANGGPPTPGANGSTAASATVRVAVERLDELVRLLGETTAAHRRLSQMVAEDTVAAEQARALGMALQAVSTAAMEARMVPVSDIAGPLLRSVRDAARSTGKQVRWDVEGADTELDRGMLERLADPLVHLVRNAVAHGIEDPDRRVAAGKPAEGLVRLVAARRGPEVVVVVGDDGAGVDLDAVRRMAQRRGRDVTDLSDAQVRDLLFLPGVSTAEEVSELAGRGVGLDAVRAQVEALGGRVDVQSTPGEGSEFSLVVPLTLAVVPSLAVDIGGLRYALPVAGIVTTAPTLPTDQAASLSALLGVEALTSDAVTIVVESRGRRRTVSVESVGGSRDLTVHPLSPLLPRLPLVAGVTVEPDGSLVTVLDAEGIVTAEHPGDAGVASRSDLAPARPATVLVVDDALTVREVQRAILERAGYRVRTAGDGLEALRDLEAVRSDLLLTDVEMPYMDGFALVAEVRRRPSLDDLPVVVLTPKESEADRQRALDAGADAYVVKSSFGAGELLRVVDGLVERTR